MKKVLYLFFVLLAFSLFVISCSQSVSPSQTEIDNAVAKADEQSQEVVNLLADNNDLALNDYLAAEDPEGDVAALIDSYKTAMSAAASKDIGEDIPAFSDTTKYKNGDVLVFKGDASNWQGSLMSLILKGNFGHAGVLDQTAAIATGNEACVLSASIAQDENGNWINGLYLQDQSELMATTVNLGRFSVPNVSDTAIPAALDAMEYRIENFPSLYAFLHLNLEPVTRDDDYLWYCSKVPWRFYNDSFGIGIEDAGFYFGTDAKWTVMRDTLLYKVYYTFLLKILPSRWAKWAGILADRKLKRILTELITPDELWYWAQNPNNASDSELYGASWTDFWAE